MPGFTQAKHIVYQSEREVRRALIQVALYTCFVIATTIIALSTQHVLFFYFNQAMERGFLSRMITSEAGNLAFKDIATIPEWWEFVRGSFLSELDKNLFMPKEEEEDNENGNITSTEQPGKKTGNDKGPSESQTEGRKKRADDDKDGTTVPPTTMRPNKGTKFVPRIHLPEGVKSVIIFDNFMLGAIKMRQIRVQNDSCAVHVKFKKFFETCYADYSFSMEDRELYYKSTRYFTRDEYKATPVFGSLLKYDGPGYMVFLSGSLSNNIRNIDDLIKENWIDIATRAVILEFVIYNANTHLFNNVKIMAEVLPTGGVLPKFHMDIVPLYTIWSPHNMTTLISAIVFYLLVVYYTSVEIQELLKEGFRDYFGNAQNYIDITILLTAYLALTLTMIHPFKMDSFISFITRNPRSLASLDEASFWYLSYVYVMAVCVFMVWAKIFRFVGFNKTLLQFSTTLRRCIMDILGFALMFFIVFIAFALFGNMVFGSSNPDFSTFQSSLFSMVRMVLGDFPYERIEKANRVLGPIFCLSYVLFITFILLNMFLAIINETYTAVKQEIREDHNALKNFIVTTADRFRNYLKKIWRTTDDPCKKEGTPSSSMYRPNQDDTRSMYEYADVPLSSMGVKGKTQSRHRTSAKSAEEEETDQDEYAVEIRRLTERVELMNEIVERLRKNMDRLFGRLNQLSKN